MRSNHAQQPSGADRCSLRRAAAALYLYLPKVCLGDRLPKPLPRAWPDRAKRENVGMPLPTGGGGGIDGWIILDGPAGGGPGGGGGGRHAGGGGPPVRGRAL